MTTDLIRWTEEDDRELERQLQGRVAGRAGGIMIDKNAITCLKPGDKICIERLSTGYRFSLERASRIVSRKVSLAEAAQARFSPLDSTTVALCREMSAAEGDSSVMERCSSCHARIEHNDEYGLCRRCSSYLCPACFTASASGLCTWCQEEER